LSRNMTTLRLPTSRMIAALAVVSAAMACRGADVKSAAAPAVPVTVASAREADFPIELRAIGSVESLWTVAVRPQVEGALAAIHFREGQDVKAGDLLFTIDPRPYEAALAEAEAHLAKSRVEAQNANSEEKRAGDLLAQGVMSVDVHDSVVAGARAMAASVRADEAAVQTARLRLEYCTIRSPLDGRTGSILVKVGNLVRAMDDATLVVIHQQDPIGVRFTVPETRLAEIRKAGTLEVVARRRGEEKDPATGSLAFVDHEIDRTTGNVKLKARFGNAERKLWPGQFVDVSMVLSVRKGAVVIPRPCVQDGQQGPFVFVVKGDQTAEMRAVEIGPSRNGETLIEKGLSAGETVVVDGQVRLTVGAKVQARPAGPAS
jgi:membrane fusion protein, multidrug efflux system